MEHHRKPNSRVTGRKHIDGYDENMSTLFNMNLRSLMINCPHCRERGLITTKWVKGRNSKPLCVIHRNDSQGLTECRLEGKGYREIRRNIRLSRPDLRKILSKMKLFILFSGGLDSLCTLLYLLEITGNNGYRPTALHIDTTAGFPEVTQYVKRTCSKLGIPLEIVKPKRDYFELAKRWGIPSFNARWCCKELKVKPVKEFLSNVQGPKIIIDGIRAAESSQRRTYLPVWYHPTFQCISVSPILGWSDQAVSSYVQASGMPLGPASELGCSAECWCGAYKTRTDFEKLLELHPEIFDKLVAVEKAQRGRFTFIYENGHQVPLEDVQKSNLIS